jgi:hypothetical protein
MLTVGVLALVAIVVWAIAIGRAAALARRIGGHR